MAGERERLIRGRELLAGLLGGPTLGYIAADQLAHDEEDALADDLSSIRKEVAAQPPALVKAGVATVLSPMPTTDRAVVVAALRGQVDPAAPPELASPNSKTPLKNAMLLAQQAPDVAGRLASLGERVNQFEARTAAAGSVPAEVAENVNTGAAGYSPVPGVLGGVVGLGSGAALLTALRARRAGAAGN